MLCSIQHAKVAFYLIIQLPLGIALGVVMERFCRRRHAYARWRNILVKSLVSFFMVTYLDVIGVDSINRGGVIRAIFNSSIRLSLLTSGVLLGTVLQPVGLTGGIATGKSTVSSLLSRGTDFIIIDVDKIAHDILLPEKMGQDSVYRRLVDEFGAGILEDRSNKSSSILHIDRRKLGDVIFRDREKRRRLNSITHPKIIKIMLKQIVLEGLMQHIFFGDKPNQRRVVCVDIPLLFEGGFPMRALFGTIIVVLCKFELQLERLYQRNSDLTIEQCRQRIASQISVEEKACKAHIVIRNDGNLNDLKREVLHVKKEVATAVLSRKQRGVEFWWLLLGFGCLRLLTNNEFFGDMKTFIQW